MITALRRLLDPRYAILGLLEGIIVALGLGAKALFGPAETSPMHLVVNAGVISGVINLTTSWFTELYHERAELLEIERKMVISERGHYLGTALYRTRRLQTLYRSLCFGGSAFVGAAILLPAIYLTPDKPWLALTVPLAVLFLLGCYLGHRTAGRAIVWGLSMAIAGVCMTVVGLLFPA
jgi:predicted membrane protein (TIGR00267 family)